jgi:hypothetical protein
MTNPLEVKENDEKALDFALSVSVSLDFPCMADALFPESLSNHCQGLVELFPRSAQYMMLFLDQIHHKRK